VKANDGFTIADDLLAAFGTVYYCINTFKEIYEFKKHFEGWNELFSFLAQRYKVL
jgi:hypothetical protein